jgi:hypothetical protein
MTRSWRPPSAPTRHPQANPLTHWQRHSIVRRITSEQSQDLLGARMRKLRQCSEKVKRNFGIACSALVLLASAGGWLTPAAARPLFPAEERFFSYRGVLPACDDPAVFERIRSRFFQREAEFWKSGLAISGFDHAREIGFRSNGVDYIPRRYCIAEALMNDSKVRRVSYSVDEDLGIIGFGFEVEWCVAGLDRLNAFAPQCTMAQP